MSKGRINYDDTEIVNLAFENVSEDGKVQKFVKIPSNNPDHPKPKDGDRVRVNYKGYLEDMTSFDSNQTRDEFEFTIGQGVIQGWSIGVKTMGLGEVAVFKIDSEYGYGESGSPPKIPGGATLYFTVELLEIDVEMTDEEAFNKATEVSEEGKKSFQSGDLSQASVHFEKALKLLKSHYSDDISKLKVSLNNNLSLVYTKLSKFKDALKHAEKVLSDDQKNEKALVRKCSCLISLSRLDEAEETIKEYQKAYPDDGKTVDSLRGSLGVKREEQRKTQDNLYRKMAGKA